MDANRSGAPSGSKHSTGERFDARRLAQAISAVERGGSEADALIATALARLATGSTPTQRVIGVTGAPGVGKSSLIAALSDVARAAGRRVAILAIDPSSAISGGALLGDRAEIGCNSVLNPGSIIGRASVIYPGVNWRSILPANMIVKNKAAQEVVVRRPRES